MERVIDGKSVAPGIVALSAPSESSQQGGLTASANCYEDGCFHGCIDSCDCIADGGCDRVPDPLKP